MSRVICPNCQGISQHWKNCENCYAKLAAPASLRGAAPSQMNRGKILQADMDGHSLRCQAHLQQHQMRKLPAAATKQDESLVVVKVSDLDAFTKAVGGKNIGAKIAGELGDPTWIVTARIATAKVAALRKQKHIISLKHQRRLRPCLEQTRREIGASVLSPKPNAKKHEGAVPDTDRKDAIIGIVDLGLDFRHRNFRDADGNTRILALWDQKGTDQKNVPAYGYGRVFETKAINHALQADDPYRALGYEVPADSNFEIGAHGTYVTDVAAGNGLGSGQRGIATEADIIFVDVATGTANSAGNVFADSVQILDAVDFIFAYASKLNRPCVINISLGTNEGPHDGSSLVEQGIDRLAQAAPGRAVVVAAGNAANRKIHTTGVLKEGETRELKWLIPAHDRTTNEVEIWYPGCDEISVQVVDPKGQPIKSTQTKCGKVVSADKKRKGIVSIFNRQADPNNGNNTINIFVEHGVEGGEWKICLTGEKILNGKFSAWIERDELGQSTLEPANDDTTLSSLACGHNTIVVGAYNAKEDRRPPLETSSKGPTQDGRLKPDIAAPGFNILAARSGTEVLCHRQSGTSMAAAVVTGVVALLLSEAQARGIQLFAHQIRNLLILTAERPTNESWHPQYGYGLVQADAALAVVAAL